MATASSAETRPRFLAAQIAFWLTPQAAPSFASEPARAIALVMGVGVIWFMAHKQHRCVLICQPGTALPHSYRGMRWTAARLGILAAWLAAVVLFEKATGLDGVRWSGYVLLAGALAVICWNFSPNRRNSSLLTLGAIAAVVGLMAAFHR